jgi:hypothetical protein
MARVINDVINITKCRSDIVLLCQKLRPLPSASSVTLRPSGAHGRINVLTEEHIDISVMLERLTPHLALNKAVMIVVVQLSVYDLHGLFRHSTHLPANK